MTSHAWGVALLAVAVAGCGTEATIRTADGRVYEGTLAPGTIEEIRFESGVGVPRSQIVDIDHPGNGAAITGAALIAYGIPNGLLGESRLADDDDDDIENRGAYRLGAWAPLAVGLGLLPYGLVVWRASRANAEDTSGAPKAAPTALVPFTTVEGRNTTIGALWGGRF